MAPLVVEYGTNPGWAMKDEMDARFTIAPPPRRCANTSQSARVRFLVPQEHVYLFPKHLPATYHPLSHSPALHTAPVPSSRGWRTSSRRRSPSRSRAGCGPSRPPSPRPPCRRRRLRTRMNDPRTILKRRPRCVTDSGRGGSRSRTGSVVHEHVHAARPLLRVRNELLHFRLNCTTERTRVRRWGVRAPETRGATPALRPYRPYSSGRTAPPRQPC